MTSPLTTQVKPKTLAGQEIIALETIFLFVYVVSVRETGPSSWPVPYWQFLILLGGERHHLETGKDTLVLQEISAKQNLHETGSYGRMNPGKKRGQSSSFLI